MSPHDFRLCVFFKKLVFFGSRKTFSLRRFSKSKNQKNSRKLKLAATTNPEIKGHRLSSHGL
jgi:DNA polymerase III delta subunit